VNNIAVKKIPTIFIIYSLVMGKQDKARRAILTMLGATSIMEESAGELLSNKNVVSCRNDGYSKDRLVVVGIQEVVLMHSID
jgi:hypothetical protein